MKTLKTLSDEELMIRYQKAADERAFDELYQRYSGKLFGYLYQKVHNKALSEDILQITFLKTHKNKEKYLPEYKFSTWIFSICRHALIDMFRKQENREVGSSDVIDSFPNPESASEHSMFYFPKKLLTLLPLPQQKAIELRYFEELDYPKIALKLNTTEQNTRKLVSRGINHLRKILQEKSS